MSKTKDEFTSIVFKREDFRGFMGAEIYDHLKSIAEIDTIKDEVTIVIDIKKTIQKNY